MTPYEFIRARRSLRKVIETAEREIDQLRRLANHHKPRDLNSISQLPNPGDIVWFRVGNRYQWIVVETAEWGNGPFPHWIVIVDEFGCCYKGDGAKGSEDPKFWREI